MREVIEKYKLKKRKKCEMTEKACSFLSGSFFDEGTVFEGRNLMAENSKLFHCKLGFASYVGESTVLSQTRIGRFSSIGPCVKNVAGTHPSRQFVSTHPCFYSLRKQVGFTFSKEQLFTEYTYADSEELCLNIIGNDVWIGEDTLIMQGVTIGDGAIVAMGAVVNKNVAPYAIVGGVPAKVIGYRFDKEDIDFLCSLKWWEKDYKWIKEHSRWFHDINMLRENV